MNGFIIIDRHLARPVNAAGDHLIERMKQAKLMADRRVGDRESLILNFMNKLASSAEPAIIEQISFSIRAEHPLDLHNGKSLDLEKMMHLL